MGNATSELTDSLHLLRLAKLFFQKLLFSTVPKNGDDALLSGNLDDLGRIQSRAPFTRLGKKSNFQAANRALFLEDLEKSGAIFGRLPKFQLQGSATNDLLSLISGDAKETLIHIDVATFCDRGDRNRFGIRVERFLEPLLCLLALGNVTRSEERRVGKECSTRWVRTS